jgi:hypothetical protein
MILTVWEKCHGEERLAGESSKLSEHRLGTILQFYVVTNSKDI